MKNQTFTLLFLGLLLALPVLPLKAEHSDRFPPGNFWWTIEDIFSEGERFSPGAFFLWGDYQQLSNRGKRPELTRLVLPMVGLNLERHLWLGLGARFSVSTHWWEEDKVLVRTDEVDYKELFLYQYWTAGLGLTWHFNTNSRWDPYLGYLFSFRLSAATCECYTDIQTATSHDFFLGTRFFLASRLFLTIEAGQHGNGYVKAGLGVKIR